MSYKQKSIVWTGLLVAVVFLSALAFVAGRPRRLTGPAEGSTPTKTHGLPQDKIEAELITIRPAGFDPTEITRPPGRFTLAVNNLSGLPELDLMLDREAGARQHEGRLPRGQLGWKKTVDLPPGTYTLTEVNHPSWVCRITITAK